jgi:hypothetical protein
MYSESDLRAASAAGILEPPQLARLLEFLKSRAALVPAAANTPGPRFDVAHLLWYAGALIVIGAMGLFSTLAFSQMGGNALAITACVYAGVFWAGGHYLWTNKNLRTPGGLLIAIAVSMAPLAVFGVQEALGWWGKFGNPGAYQGFYVWIKGSWLFMEIAAILTATLALRVYRFPFIVSIMAVALWFMSMDLAPWIAGMDHADYETRRQLSIAFGAAVLVVAYIVDRSQRTGDFAFWLYLFGMLAFWGGISMTSGGTVLQKAIYCAMNVGLLFVGVFLARRVFAVFGVIGITMYLGDLANHMFKDSLMFPFALSLIGVAVIALGLLYYRNQDRIAGWIDTNLPDGLKRLRPVPVA